MCAGQAGLTWLKDHIRHQNKPFSASFVRILCLLPLNTPCTGDQLTIAYMVNL